MSWMVFGASVRGPDHEREGLPCQDAWASEADRETTAICLCDGAGTASHAEIGARVVASAVVGALREAAPGQGLDQAVLAACHAGRRALLHEAEARALAPGDLACTVVAIAARGGRIATAHLGDGAVVARRAGGVFVLSPPDAGEYAGETWFLSAPSWEARLRLALHDDVDAFCALTDGCQRASLVAGPDLRPFAPFYDPLFGFADEATDADLAADEVRQLLDGALLRRSSGDDKTLAVARLRAAM